MTTPPSTGLSSRNTASLPDNTAKCKTADLASAVFFCLDHMQLSVPLLPGYDNRLIKAGFLRKFPFHVTEALFQKNVCQCVSQERPVFTVILPNLQVRSVLDNVLGKSIVIILPVPCLKGNSLTIRGFMDIRRRLGRFLCQ